MKEMLGGRVSPWFSWKIAACCPKTGAAAGRSLFRTVCADNATQDSRSRGLRNGGHVTPKARRADCAGRTKLSRALTRVHWLAQLQHLAEKNEVSGPAFSFQRRKLLSVAVDLPVSSRWRSSWIRELHWRFSSRTQALSNCARARGRSAASSSRRAPCNGSPRCRVPRLQISARISASPGKAPRHHDETFIGVATWGSSPRCGSQTQA